jgi:hypothetical protein
MDIKTKLKPARGKLATKVKPIVFDNIFSRSVTEKRGWRCGTLFPIFSA